MRKRLIINADDFGLHEAVNRAVVRGFTAGCLTSASLMAGGPAFAQAAQIASAQAGLSVGVHLTLVACCPVLAPERIPSLVDSSGCFAAEYPQFLKRLCQGKINLAEVHQELSAQVAKVRDAGVKISHLDSHQHLHVVPAILAIVLDIARQFGIRALRIPQEPICFLGGYQASAGRLLGRSGLSVLAALARRRAAAAGMKTTEHFFGMLAGGSLREENLLAIIAALPPGDTEIMLHPGDDNAAMAAKYGWGYHWEEELAAVSSETLRQRLAREKIELISFAGV